MTQSFTDEQLNHLLGFIGYGAPKASFWFLGMEEGGGGENNLRTRLQFNAIEDCKKAHCLLGITKFHSGQRVIQRTWRSMCYIMLALANQEPSREAIRDYQAKSLGSSDGETLLVELMPIPKRKISDWEYNKIIPQFTSSQHYYDVVKPQRIELLRTLLMEHTPQVVIGYGKKYWEDYKQLFPSVQFTSSDQFEIGRSNGTLVVLTDHFTARTMNGKLDALVDLILFDD